MVKFLMAIFKFNFGKFEEREFRKFLRMGFIFLVVIGIYWSMRPLKDSLFIQLAGAIYLPYAKTVSVILMIPFVGYYTKLLDVFPKSKLLTLMPPVFYGTIMLLYAAFIWAFQKGMIASSILTVALGYLWYFFVESFGSVIVALFWAFSTDITKPESAKQGFPLIYSFGQMGGVIAPYLFINIPIRIGMKSDAFSIAILALLTFLITPLVRYFIKKTPEDLMVSVVQADPEKTEKKKKGGFADGLKVLFSHKYLLGMFACNFFFEFIITVFDFNFKLTASGVYSGIELTQYLASYASAVNLVSLACLLLGVNKITKIMGISVSLASLPVIFGLAIFGFFTIHSLTFLFCLMTASKAINYALNGPSLKQLYIPTSKDAKCKAQAWVETFGSRISKECGSGMNMLFKPLGTAAYHLLSGGLGFAFVGAWFFIALYLGRTHKKAIDTNTIVC